MNSGRTQTSPQYSGGFLRLPNFRCHFNIGLLMVKFLIVIDCQDSPGRSRLLLYNFHKNLFEILPKILYRHLLPAADNHQILRPYFFHLIGILISHNIARPFKILQMPAHLLDSLQSLCALSL